eukprot:2008764-Pyramimonas_sp.AAC.1
MGCAREISISRWPCAVHCVHLPLHRTQLMRIALYFLALDVAHRMGPCMWHLPTCAPHKYGWVRGSDTRE